MVQKLISYFILFTIIALIVNSCCKPAKCISFVADELTWIPYTDGQIISFKGNLSGRIYSFTATKQHEGTTKATCHEGQNYCLSYLRFYLNCNDTLGMFLELDNSNYINKAKKSDYSLTFQLDNTKIFSSIESNGNLQTKVINGITYNNVATYPTFDNKYNRYYLKGDGLVAFNNTITNEWFYKQ